MNKTITILNLPVEEYHNVSNIIEILNEIKQSYSLIQLDPSMPIEKVNALITGSELIIISGPNIFGYYGKGFIDTIIAFYNSGGNIIYEIAPNLSELQNEFLNYFQMKPSETRLRLGLSYDVPFAMTSHSFRDRYIYKGIEQIIVTQPNHINFWGASEPILMSNGSFLSIDSTSDLISNFPSSNITPIAFQENKNEGLFVCINGFIKISNLPNPIDNNNNFKFLINLFQMILRKKSRYELAYTEYRKIEQSLIFIVMSELKKQSQENWIEMIPAQVIDNIYKNRPQITSIEEALDFIQLKKIIKHNWIFFQSIFEMKEKLGKEKSLKWMDWVNDIRKDIAHPVKDLKDKSITYEIINKLRNISQMLSEIGS